MLGTLRYLSWHRLWDRLFILYLSPQWDPVRPICLPWLRSRLVPWAALAPSMPAMLAARTVQRVSGGVLFALSYALIRVVFDSHLWPRAMALGSGIWGVATLGGPAMGGIFA